MGDHEQLVVLQKYRIEVVADNLVKRQAIPTCVADPGFLEGIGALKIHDRNDVTARVGTDDPTIGGANNLMRCRQYRLA